MTVVGADALYLKPFTTSIIMLGPGQTPDVLVKADQTPGRYHIAARAYASAQNAPFDNTTTTTILQYTKENKIIVTCLGMSSSLQRYLQRHHLHYQPQKSLQTSIGGNIFFTVGLGLNPCPRGRKCQGPNGTRFTASMNNVSFILPSTFSLLQAHDQGVNGMSTTDFPGAPPLKFNYTGNVSRSLWTPTTGSKFYKLKYGARVQIVLQVTSIFTTENQPIHLHGNNFNIIAEGFGNFNANKDTSKFNLVDPPMRNTVAVTVGGWSVIHFVADNPGIWLMHCHLDVHITWGLAMAFLVENGVGELQSLKAPPADLPKC